MGNIIISAVRGVEHLDPMQCCVSSEFEPENVFLKHYFMSFKMLLDFFFLINLIRSMNKHSNEAK